MLRSLGALDDDADRCRALMGMCALIGHICAGTGLTPVTSAPGLGSPPATSAPGLGSPLATSAPGRGSPLPHLRRDWARPCHICAGTGFFPAHICAGAGGDTAQNASRAHVASSSCDAHNASAPSTRTRACAAHLEPRGVLAALRRDRANCAVRERVDVRCGRPHPRLGTVFI